MIGPSGSGKSRTAKDYQEKTGLDLIIDVDEFKHQLNEFKPLCKNTNLALHGPASLMAKAELDKFRTESSGWVLYDSTGKNFDKVNKRAMAFLSEGFEVEFLLVENDYINTVINVSIRNRTSQRKMMLRQVTVIWVQCVRTQRKIKRGLIAGCEIKRLQGFKRIFVTK